VTVLLGGSLGTTGAMWDPLLDVLGGRVDALPYDALGHGTAPVPPGPYEIADLGRHVLGLMDERGLGRASFCGLSIGGMTGMWLAANAPERIDRLILICTAALLRTGYRERAAAVRAAGSVEPIADAVVERWLTPACAAAQPELVAWLRAQLVATPAAGYAACCEAIEAMDLRPDLARIAAPTLVIAAAHDPATPPALGRAIAEAVAGARYELVDAAHLAAVERPAVVARLVLEHLGEGEERP
jgi:3-oxoadipate enol-lactonase